MKYLEIKNLENIKQADKDGLHFTAEIRVKGRQLFIQYKAKLDPVRLRLVVDVFAEGDFANPVLLNGLLFDRYGLIDETAQDFIIELRHIERENQRQEREVKEAELKEIRELLK